ALLPSMVFFCLAIGFSSWFKLFKKCPGFRDLNLERLISTPFNIPFSIISLYLVNFNIKFLYEKKRKKKAAEP
ncbi:MAG: hypothetical protein IKR97_00105, partial [Eubacterium sp.]|nr:hypothetical protein [Eubacterium sp.]